MIFVSHVLSGHRIVVVKVWAVPSLESGVGQGKHETLLVGDTDWDRGGSQQFAITQCRHDYCVQTRPMCADTTIVYRPDTCVQTRHLCVDQTIVCRPDT